jgi:hypothetical protein
MLLFGWLLHSLSELQQAIKSNFCLDVKKHGICILLPLLPQHGAWRRGAAARLTGREEDKSRHRRAGREEDEDRQP